MFAPLGYIPAIQLYDRIYRLGLAEIRFTKAARYQKEGGISLLDYNNILLARETFADWGTWRILLEQVFQPYVASPDGRILVASSFFFQGHPSEKVDTFSPIEPNLANLEWNKTWRDFYDSGVNPPWDQLPFISQDTWTVRSVKEVRVRLDAGDQHMSYSEWENLIAPLQGWAVCFKECQIPTDDALLELLTDLGADLMIGASAEVPQRPTRRRAAAEIFSQLYPDGRGGAPWKEVARAVEAKLGRSVSVKTLTRAVGEMDNERTAP